MTEKIDNHRQNDTIEILTDKKNDGRNDWKTTDWTYRITENIEKL